MEDVVHVARRVPNMGTVQQAAKLYGLSPRISGDCAKLAKCAM